MEKVFYLNTHCLPNSAFFSQQETSAQIQVQKNSPPKIDKNASKSVRKFASGFSSAYL
jgi:hypothetical protein